MADDSRAGRARRRRVATALRRRDRRRPRRSFLSLMPDLSRFPLDALASLTEMSPAMAAAMRRIRVEAGGQADALAGFNSAL